MLKHLLDLLLSLFELEQAKLIDWSVNWQSIILQFNLELSDPFVLAAIMVGDPWGRCLYTPAE